MPNPDYTEAFLEALASCPSNVVILDTLSFHHPVAGNKWIVSDTKDHILTLESGSNQLFKAVGFKFTLPAQNDSGFQELVLNLDNTDREASDYVISAMGHSDPIEVKYRPYLSTNPNQPQLDPPITLYLRSAVLGVGQITGRISFADILNRRFGNELYTTKRFPALRYF